MRSFAEKLNIWFNFNSKKKKLLFCFCVTFILGFLGYAFSFFNPSVKSDGTAFNYRLETDHLYGMGRFTMRLWQWLTSMDRVEFVDGIFWFCFIALIAYFADSLFEFNDKFFVFVISSVFIFSGISIRCYQYFPYCAPLFMLSVLLGVLSVYLLRKNKYGWIYFILINAAGMGIYQNEICVSIGLIAIFTVCDLLRGKSVKSAFLGVLKGILLVLASVVLYFVVYKITLKIFKIYDYRTYNSSQSLAFYGFKRSMVLFVKSYVLFFRNLVVCGDCLLTGWFSGFSSVYEIYLMILWVIAIYLTVAYLFRLFTAKKFSVIKRVVISAIICLLPFLFACICVVTNGLVMHNLYVQDYLIVVLPFIFVKEYKKCLASENEGEFENGYELTDKIWFLVIFVAVSLAAVALSIIVKSTDVIITFICQLVFVALALVIFVKKTKYQIWSKLKRSLLCVLSVLFVFNGIIYANAKATENYVDSKTQLAKCTILHEIIENSGEYEEGALIYIVGEDDNVPYYYIYYMNTVFGTDYRYYVNCPEEKANELKENEEVKDLPCFPSKDCVKMVDGVLVIKSS